MGRKSSIILFIIACIAITGCQSEKVDKCTLLERRIDSLQDKVNLWLDRFNALHSLTSRFGRGILEGELHDCQFQQLLDEPLKFRVIRCPEIVAEYPGATDIFIEVYQKTENNYDHPNSDWTWRIREVKFATK